MTTAPTPLQDVLYAFSLAKPIPDAELLEEFTRRYPDHAAALTEFAIEVAVDALRGREELISDATEPAAVSPAVSRAMSAFQNRLFELQTADASATQGPPVPTSGESNPFATLDRPTFRRIAVGLGANTVFVSKLRDRQIDPATMSEGFRRRVSIELNVPLEVLDAHLAGPPVLSNQLYKADGKPEAPRRQTFEQAVRGCGLSEAQQQLLLKL